MAAGKPKKKNPRLASGRKRARQDAKLNAANTSLRSKYRTSIKKVEKAVLAGNKENATKFFSEMQKVVDSVADKDIFHKNKAARDKSRLAAKVKALVLKQTPAEVASAAPAAAPVAEVKAEPAVAQAVTPSTTEAAAQPPVGTPAA